MLRSRNVWIITILVIFLVIVLVIINFSKGEVLLLGEIREDLGDNFLNYIDKPSFLTSQALRLIIPPLVDYDQSCYPYSKILKEVPSLENGSMFLDNKRTVIILKKDNCLYINPLDIIPTIQLLNLDSISTKWVYRNVLESIDRIDKITDFDVMIRYKLAYSLPYFPSPVIFDDQKKFYEQIIDYTYKDKKNFLIFPKYSRYEVIKSETNYFVIRNNEKTIIFKTYKDVEKLKKDIKKLDVAKIPAKLVNLFVSNMDQDQELITMPNKEIFFIFFNPNLDINKREKIYLEFLNHLNTFDLGDYQINKTYILPYHFAAIDFLSSKIKESKKVKIDNLKVLVTYKDRKSQLVSNLIEEIFTKNFGAYVLKVNMEEKVAKKDIFGFLIEPPEPSLRQNIDPYRFDLIITSITFLPYMNYYYVYSKDGKYNVYGVSNREIEGLLDRVMQGFGYEQKNYLVELQKKLADQFLIVPILIDKQVFIVKRNIKIGPLGFDL